MKVTLLSIFFCCLSGFLLSQSSAIVYSENFNSGTGGWIIGGFRPSWKYGAPTLPHIASNGTNCFCTGDAGAASVEPFGGCPAVSGPTTTGNYYNCCERSYIESPSIDFSFVGSPILSLDINLYCEQTFDGAKAQISFDSGITWTDIGSYTNSTYEQFPFESNCRDKNWYNKNIIMYLSGTAGGCSAVTTNFTGSDNGWSGGCAEVGSGGSCVGADLHGTNGWITATHCIAEAAYQPDVKIRIVFGGGSQVYSDGIAIDNVIISEVYPIASFTSTPAGGCTTSLNFTNTTDCSGSWEWNFGHPAIPPNTSTDENPVHEFPTSGNYNVTLISTDFCGGTDSISQLITVNPVPIPEIGSIDGIDPLLCDSASGNISISFLVPGAPTPPVDITYMYNGNLVQEGGFLSNPIELSGLYPGTYSEFHFIDATGCEIEDQTVINLLYSSDNLELTVSEDLHIDKGSSASLLASTNIPSTFVWSPPESLDDAFSANPIATPLVTTTYLVQATDTSGCIASEEVTIYVDDSQPCERYFFPNTFTPNNDHKNDVFMVFKDPALELASFEMNIMNRWGQTVFTSKQPEVGWDGKSFPGGIYIVVADFGCTNKKSSRYTGTVNLMR